MLLFVAITITLFVSCKKESETNEENSNQTDIREYGIIRVDLAEQNLSKMTSRLKKLILDYTKAELAVKTDFVKHGEELDENTDKNAKEILIGDTNRSASKEALAELSEKGYENGYIIKATENKIVIVGTSDTDTVFAVRYFMNNYVLKSNEENMLPIKAGDVVMNGNEAKEIIYIGDSGQIFAVEERSRVFTPKDADIYEACTYGKIIKLEHQSDPKNNGMLLATKENGSYESTAKDKRWPILRSTDDGKTWEEIFRLGDIITPGAGVGLSPYIFELPENVGEFKKGTILFASCSFAPNPTILLQYSENCGERWCSVCYVDKGGPAQPQNWDSQGVWEPVLKYEDGRLYCFYSDELDNGVGPNHEGGHNQRLVYKYTTDLKTWSEKKECVAVDTPDHRAGMVSLTKMGNGKWALAFEYTKTHIFIKYADNLDSWDASDPGKMVKTADGKVMQGSPAIAWTPNGGDCGTLFVTAHFSSNSKTQADMFMSFDYGETYVSVDNPIDIKQYQFITQLYGGYSAGMYVDNEGTLYYVSNPQNKDHLQQEVLEFIRIKIYE